MSAAKKGKRAASEGSEPRLRLGELDGLVLAYMREHEDELPLTAGAIGKGIRRSFGAVANCLVRLTKDKEVRRAKRKPLAYDLKSDETVMSGRKMGNRQ
jgi:hypothetical protein